MSLRAILSTAAFDELPDTTVIGKDSFKKNEKDNQYYLDLPGDEAGKLAVPLQESVKRLEANNKTLLDEKIKAIEEKNKFTALGKTPEEIDEILKTGTSPDIAQLEAKHKAQLDSIQRAAEAEKQSIKEQLDATRLSQEELSGQIRKSVQESEVAKVMTKFEMNAAGRDYLMNRIEVVPEEEGSSKYITRVIENGEPAYKAGVLKTLADVAEEARANAELSGMFNGGTAGGSGGSNNQGGGQVRGGFVRADDQAALSANLEKIASGEVKVSG